MKTTPSIGATTKVVDIPANKSHNESQNDYRKTDKGKSTKNAYRHRTSTWHTEASYLSREFIAWDGEGITIENGDHLYTLLASSSGITIRNPNGLGTAEIFNALINGKESSGDGIHIIYGGSYDFNMFVRDFSLQHLNRLYESGACYWMHYRVEWRRGKSFRITDRDRNITITIYDVVSFFQCPFVKACDDYLGSRFIEREMIVANKAARGTFTADDDETVDKYNQAELTNLVNLMTELRERLVKVHLRPRRWDGPGAIATALLSREGIKDAMKASPPRVARAARFAYAGGRFEVIQCGDVKETAYEYDINSAYPTALRTVPDLTKGYWLTIEKPDVNDVEGFALWEVEWIGSEANMQLPQPFFVRGPDGSVCFPLKSSGTYWTPEVIAGFAYAAKYGGSIRVTRGWKFKPTVGDNKPFAFIDPMYLKRQALKKAKDGAHVGLKLGLNSLYGKTCQRVGWQPATKDTPTKIPPFHQLEWAGYVTSWCRAEILTAALEDLSAVIAFETDALFSTRPLAVSEGSGLGEWEYTEFDALCYVQSGMYFGITDGKPFAKTRGVDRDTLTYEHASKRLNRHLPDERYVDATLTRFIGVGLARQLNNWTRWTHWETAPKRIKLAPSGKREHVDEQCEQCTGHGLADGVWHRTYPPAGPLQSHEYPIPWVNPNDNMTELDEFASMRREEMAADYE